MQHMLAVAFTLLVYVGGRARDLTCLRRGMKIKQGAGAAFGALVLSHSGLATAAFCGGKLKP